VVAFRRGFPREMPRSLTTLPTGASLSSGSYDSPYDSHLSAQTGTLARTLPPRRADIVVRASA
jgi:hypothetical protein